jgi:RHS repeat-associated protein
MKTSLLLALGLIAAATICRAQDEVINTNTEWFSIDGIIASGLTNSAAPDPTPMVQVQANFQPMTPPTPPIIAEVITPEIQALADGMQDDPLKIYKYVHDHIRHVLYFGSKKGAQMTLLEKSGNDFDQCALLVALLRAAGYSDAGYQFGWMVLPYDSTDGSDRDIHHWLNLDLTNSNWSATTGYLDYLFRSLRGYPITAYNWGNNLYAMQRVWVTVTVGGTNYSLDPAFKVTERISGVDLPTAMGFSIGGLTNAAGGLDVGNSATNFYSTNLTESVLRGTLAGYTTNLLNYIQSNNPNASVEQILSGSYIVPSTNTTLSANLVFAPTNLNGTMPVITWVNEPTNMMATFAISYLGTNYQWFAPQLQGQRLSLTVSSSGSAQLWQEDTLLATKSSGGGSGTFNVTITTYYPGFQSGWNTTSNTFIPGGAGQPWESSSKGYENANATYAILYAYEPDWGWLQERQRQLDVYRQQGLADTSRQVVSETLNIMGLNWQMQVETIEKILAQKIGVCPMFYHRIGRMSQETGYGYYVDIYMATVASISSSNQNDNHSVRWMDEVCYFGSAMEHGLIEQLQATNLVGASTIKILELANTNHQAVYLANSTNWSAISGKLVNYSAGSLSSIGGFCSQGNSVLLPQNGLTQLAGSGSWSGYGLLVHNPNGGVSMLIGDSSGVHNGGYVSDLGATVSPTWIDYSAYSQPLYFSSSPVSVPNITGADPVNMADGTFQVQATDLSLGQTEPRGLSFSRYYSSSRRNSNLAAIAPGWIHNYYLNAATVSSPQAGLGSTTPAQMAAMMVAITAANGFYNGDQPDPKNWETTALIAKWGIDQLTAKAVSVTLGKDTIQFIKQPDGSFTPPANNTMTLTQSGSAYSLQERHGRTFKFNAAGWGTNIIDQYNQPLKLAYNSSNWVTSVTDWKSRTLTYTYSTTSPKHLISVADSAGRTIGLGYSSSNDLASVTDPESKTNKFLYDTNHQITATFNANGQLVASNIFNGFGRVTTQLTQGDPNKTWKIFWSGWQTVSQDPAGGQQSYFYDDKTRLIGQQDALGNLTQKFYDGQDHVVMTVSPLGETNQFAFDGNNNLIQTTDPLGFNNQLTYDGQNNLIQAVDGRGNVSAFGYNGQFSLTGQTNGAGDWVNHAYNGDGTLASRTDSGGMTSYTYDGTYGQLIGISYPGSLGSESFANNSLGDVTNHTDARGFATGFQYNLRRQLTNSIAPTNLTARISYDAVGNVSSTTDRRGFSTTNAWSATGKLLAIKLPATPQGTPIVTNTYDNRDWLMRTLDPLQKAMQFTNDIAGRLIAATDPLLQTANIGYDANGHTLASTNAAGEVTRQQWDARGKLVKLTDGAGHTVSRGYDATGNQIILTNRNGKVWQFQFDGANRLTNTITPLGHSTTLAINHQGLPASTKDAAGQTTTYNYDAKGRLSSRADSVGTTTYNSDANNNITGVTENGFTNSWTYDAYNRPSSCRDVFGNLIQYRYDANGNVTNLVYPNGKNVYYAFDSNNHMTNVTDWAGRKTAITYDLAGHLTGITRPNGTQRTIGYDSAGQTTNILETTAIGFPIAWFKFNWDGAARAQWEFSTPLPHVATVATRTMTYDDDNRILKFQGPSMGTNSQSVSVDLDGNLTSAPLTNDTFVTYVFDARNRLSNAGGVTNAYDPAGNRVGITYGTNSVSYVVNPNTKLPQVLIRIKNGVTNYYIYGVGLLYEITESATATNTRAYIYDYRGSTVALTDDNGNVTDRIEYSAYGITTYRVGISDTPFLFSGKYGVMTDPNGLLYMRARNYNPYLCRFINPDPSGFSGGLNFYAYANGNPVSYVDPFGLGAISDALAAASWFNAPTPEETQIQTYLAGFVNFVTLGAANLVSSAVSGTDLTGNQLDFGDAFQQTLQSGAFVASLALALPTDGASLELEEAVVGSESAATGGEGAFASYMARAQTMDVSTAENGAVFWSGNGNQALAEQFAAANGRQTLEMTPGGSWMQAQDLFNPATSPLTRQQASQVWDTLSGRFAGNASGTSVGFINGARATSTFNRIEYNALLNNPNIVNVLTGGH